jgi:hypothetical protein
VVLIRPPFGASEANLAAKRHDDDSHSIRQMCGQVWAKCGHPNPFTTPTSSAALVPEAQADSEYRNRLEAELYHNVLPIVEPPDDRSRAPTM